MAQIDRLFVGLGLIWLILGMLLGFYMGATGDNTYLDVHVAMLLGGFVLFCVYGALYRLWPVLKKGTLPNIQFWIALAGAVGIVIGTILLVNRMGPAVAASGSAFAIVAAVLMAWLFWNRTGTAG